MENTIEYSKTIVENNEKAIANILHDIKSPLYSIKIGLQNQLNSELNRDIFETTLDLIQYIEDFLTNYNFKHGKFENQTSNCDIKNLLKKKLDSCKYIFKNKNISIDVKSDKTSYVVNSIPAFISSIMGNIVSNIALHASEKSKAIINLYKKDKCIFIDFENQYDATEQNFRLGLSFCQELAQISKIEMNFQKHNNIARTNLKIPANI